MTAASKNIRAEADEILRSGLRSVLDRHGEVHLVGSYLPGLMTWRDLDIHVVRLGNLSGRRTSGVWKIDTWQTNQQAFDVVRRYGEVLSARLNDTNRAVILEIKAACWRHPEYRRGFTSGDVYAACSIEVFAMCRGFGRTFVRRRHSGGARLNQSLHNQRRKFEHEAMDRRDAAEDLPTNPNEDANASA